MWRYGNNSAADYAAGEFANYLGLGYESDSREDELTWDKSPSLMRAVHLWLIRGDGTEVCPSYESFLLALVTIINDWIEEDFRGVRGCPISLDADRASWPKVPLFSKDSKESSPGERELHHPLLQRDVFYQIKAIRDRERKLDDREDDVLAWGRLFEHLGVPELPQE